MFLIKGFLLDVTLHASTQRQFAEIWHFLGYAMFLIGMQRF